ncbi:MAG: hypothetical protein JWP91_1333 [Fibrobacteres bacterium]|nr:hypothetical protein [Fibrobacterota bacterium]
MDSISASDPGRSIPALGLALAILFAIAAEAGASRPFTASRSPASDFSVQGEYSGKARRPGIETDLGAQVVALGSGEFRVVFFPGGLPGEGIQGTTRFESAGKSGLEGTGIIGDEYHGVIHGDSLKGGNTPGDTFILIKRDRVSPTLGLAPPENATVLFGGGSVEEWTNAKLGAGGFLEPLEREAVTRKSFSNFSLHVEFRLPFLPFSIGQARANSGLRFLTATALFTEIQTLDSFGSEPGTEECGGIESMFPPVVMAVFPPMAWQTYDIHLTTPVGPDTGEARMTVWQNGILIHPGRIIPRMASAVNIALQNLDSAGAFRNMWVLEGNDRYPFFPGAAVRSRDAGRNPSGRSTERVPIQGKRGGNPSAIRFIGPGGNFLSNGIRIP